ncbi:MAG: ROK family protein [Bacteroidales bacterium]|nr:ROK family protein [Bacteroidales bacterium]
MSLDIVIGMDIGGTYTKYGFVDRSGNSYMEGSVDTAGHPDIDSYLENLFSSINASLKKADQEFNIKGIGVGAPNGNYYNGTIEYAPNLNWKGVIRLADRIKKFHDVPVVLTNDANAAALGEMMYGGARSMKDFIVITLGTGLGSGIVINGKVVYGHDGFAGEMGHIVAVDNGRQCGCGKKGCLETYASATGIKRTVFELLSERCEPTDLRDIPFNKMTSKNIAEAAGRGDKIAMKAFEITGKILGRNLANAVAFSSPEAIFLFGGLAQAGNLIIKPTKEHMEKNLLKIFQNKVKLLPSGLHDKNAAVLGAGGLIWNELLS